MLRLLIFALFCIGLNASAVTDCGPHPFYPETQSPVKFSKHGFIIQAVDKDERGYYLQAVHFSNNTPRHYFNAMIRARLDKSEYLAVKAAFAEHPGKRPEGMFAPFLFMTSRPIRGAAPNKNYGFCMKDFRELAAGKKRQLYPSLAFENNNMYGNLRKWTIANPDRGIFFRYDLKNHDPVISFKPGDIEIIFYDAFKGRR